MIDTVKPKYEEIKNELAKKFKNEKFYMVWWPTNLIMELSFCAGFDAGFKQAQEEVEKLKKQNEIMREALSKVIKAADFYSSHADCKRDSWSCKCSYCKPNDHSINVSHAKKFLKDVEGVG